MTPRHLQQRHATRYLGYHGSDTHAPFASYFEPEMASLAAHVIEALNAGPQAGPMLTVLEDAGSLLEAEWEPTETGYALLPDGSMRVAVHTPMPEVTPRMWDWWFSWHGDDTRKYKLWHPRAHVFAQWADADLHTGPRAYVGRTSYVDEYLGSRLIRAAINFLPPSALGMDETRLADPREATAICARVGLSNYPLDVGYLLHHIRRTGDGAEMRSRFWIGGRHVAPRTRIRALAHPPPSPVLRAASMTAADATALLIHCAQEMAHLAALLPALHQQFSS
ncbi:DAPG hydrolase family protein [Streptomyces anandii]|uniref:DAPG hydrolase family protein n=1 Tax=Streptomyces anandii TaxID=285454 RepID=UPI0016758B23|nr:hypothetical protein [Streptomyces anandii]GGX74942.1 hypothetical protein GCM10010510_19380 [Streptomyces anandii JCM 4720]